MQSSCGSLLAHERDVDLERFLNQDLPRGKSRHELFVGMANPAAVGASSTGCVPCVVLRPRSHRHTRAAFVPRTRIPSPLSWVSQHRSYGRPCIKVRIRVGRRQPKVPKHSAPYMLSDGMSGGAAARAVQYTTGAATAPVQPFRLMEDGVGPLGEWLQNHALNSVAQVLEHMQLNVGKSLGPAKTPWESCSGVEKAGWARAILEFTHTVFTQDTLGQRGVEVRYITRWVLI